MPSHGRHCHSKLSLAVIACHSFGIFLPFLRDLHSSLAAIPAIFCRNGSVACGWAGREAVEAVARREDGPEVLDEALDAPAGVVRLGSGRIVASK